MSATFTEYSPFPLNGNFDSYGDGTTPNAGWYTASEATTSYVVETHTQPGPHDPTVTVMTTVPDDIITLGLSDSYRTNPVANHVNSSSIETTQTLISAAGPGLHGSPAVYATTEMQINDITVKDGTQSTANGSLVNNITRGADNWGEAVGIQGSDTLVSWLNKGGQVTLTDHVNAANGHIDVNLALHLIVDPATASGVAWALANGTPFITDDGHTGALHNATSIMNSENSAAFFDPTHDFGPRTETLAIEATAPGSTVPLIGVTDIIHHVA